APLRVWRGHEGKRPVMRWAEAGDKALDISADGRRVVSAGNCECVVVWDVASAKALRTIALPARERHEAERHVYQVRISRDGGRVVGLFGPRGRNGIVGQPRPKLTDKFAAWDARTGKLLEMRRVERSGHSAVVSRVGDVLLRDDTLVDLLSGRE